jgi:ABC-type transport system involved in multi-copper enzyme maturation permease subunit
MKPVLLIALNFLRQHRWPVLLLFAYIVFTAAAAGEFGRGRPVAVDVVFYIQQQAIFICLFSAFLAADAIHAERKSRRILLLLSKAISRAEYLLAIVFAVWTVAIAYAVLSALCSVWLTARAMLSSDSLWPMLVLVIAGALISAAVAIFFSTFLNPYLATAFTLVVFCTPAAWHPHHYHAAWLPGFPLLMQFIDFGFRRGWSPNWMAVFAALVESILFWCLAVAIFQRRDIAVPVE